MDFKKIMQDYFGIALAVVIGVAVVTMYSSFMKEGGLIQGFTQDILNLVIEKVKTMIQQHNFTERILHINETNSKRKFLS